MFDFDKWQEIFATISKNKLRTGLTALGVFWGIFMLMLLLGAGRGMENGVLSMFESRAVSSMYVWSQKTSKPYKGYRANRRFEFTNDDIAAMRVSFPEIAHVAPRFHMGNLIFQKATKSGAYEVRGELPDYLYVEPKDIVSGRFLNELDVKQKRKVIVIGKRIKDVFFEKEEAAVGQAVTVAGIEYQIVGVFESKRPGEDKGEDEQIGFIPITTAQQIRNSHDRIHWFVCTWKDGADLDRMEKNMKALLRKRHNVHPDDNEAIGSWNLGEEIAKFTGLFAAINMFVWFVGIGTLIAGIVGVGNVMLIVVKERTKEIGIRKAIGATPGSIISMILLESVFITTISGYFGLLAGVGLISLIAFGMEQADFHSMFFANPEIDMVIGLQALVLLVVAGALADLVPAMHAASIKPVIALRDE